MNFNCGLNGICLSSILLYSTKQSTNFLVWMVEAIHITVQKHPGWQYLLQLRFCRNSVQGLGSSVVGDVPLLVAKAWTPSVS